MEDIIISMLSNLGLGINGVIDARFANGGEHFAANLNSFTKEKYDFTLIKQETGKFIFKTNNGLLFTYYVNTRGTIINIKIEKEK